MTAHRLRADPEPRCDLLVAEPAGEELEHVTFAGRQPKLGREC
jgi:hypothetical protein